MLSVLCTFVLFKYRLTHLIDCAAQTFLDLSWTLSAEELVYLLELGRWNSTALKHGA